MKKRIVSLISSVVVSLGMAIQLPAASLQTVCAADTANDNYVIHMDDVSHYFIMGNVQAKPGESVYLPIYVYGDTGTAGVNLKFTYDKALTLEKFRWPSAEERAYILASENAPDLYPASLSAISSNGMNLIALDGKTLINLVFKVPEDAAEGASYKVGFEKDSVDVCDTDGLAVETAVFDGTITVVTDGRVCLNTTDIKLTEQGQNTKLNLLNTSAAVTWSTSNESVAAVGENGLVIAKGFGTAEITAECGGEKYTATVTVGKPGDLNNDGSVNLKDAVLLRRYIAGGWNVALDENVADINKDGAVNLKDVVLLRRYIAGGWNVTL